MDKPYYVLLTGGKNNAGDFLIKKRAISLLSQYRQDRGIVDFDGYQALDENKLSIMNGARAVLLTGGPALQKNMYPNIYRLRKNLKDIKVPITAFGIGWHSAQGGWCNTHSYEISGPSLELLQRIKRDGLPVSVRDYHTENVMNSLGLDGIMMTGCPALYSSKSEQPNEGAGKHKKIAFSLGVAFKNSPAMYKQMQSVLLGLLGKYGKECVEVVFHHGLEKGGLSVLGVTKRLNKVQMRFLSWLDDLNITSIDISGSADNLIDYYSNVDLHIGYRVHAHIFMSSIGRPSLLLSEDGRGIALERVLGGAEIPAYEFMTESKLIERLHRFGLPFDSYKVNKYLDQDVLNFLSSEWEGDGVRFEQMQCNIGLHKKRMIDFLIQLP